MIFINDKELKIKNFPNGESLINDEGYKIKKEGNTIRLKFEGDEDITHLIFLKGYLDEMNAKADLIIPYMPYSRMDRKEGVTFFILKYLCKLINDLNFESVTIYEPHSDVCTALLNRVKVVNMSAELAKQLMEDLKLENLYLVFPDAGAEKRYSKQIKYSKILTCSKERNFKTGEIKKLEINGEVKEWNFNAIIVDDLCSKGGTFLLAAEKLKTMGAENIYLVVTHCENAIFDGDILKTDLIKKIYTTDSILNKEHKKIKVKKIV